MKEELPCRDRDVADGTVLNIFLTARRLAIGPWGPLYQCKIARLRLRLDILIAVMLLPPYMYCSFEKSLLVFYANFLLRYKYHNKWFMLNVFISIQSKQLCTDV